MKKFLLLLCVLLGTVGAWADVTVTLVDGANNPYDTYGTRNTGVTPNTFTTNAASGMAGLVLSAPAIDRAEWWSTKCLGIKNSAANTDEDVTFTAPSGYLIKSISMTVQAISSNNSYDVTVDGETTRVTGASAKEYSNISVNAYSFSFTINSVGGTVNWLAIKSMTVTLAIPFDPNNVAGKTFTMQCARGYVYYNGTQLAGTSSASNASKFAIVSYDNNTYLYDVTNSAFVCHTTAATAGTTGNAALESNNDFSKIAKNISFGATNIAAYPYYVQEDEFTNWLNMDGSPKVYLNRWTNFENGNGGNTYKIEIVDTDFDQTAAAAMLDEYFNPSATVTYVISDASGVIYTSEAFSTTIGATISELPSDLQRPYCTYDVTSATMVAGANTVNATVTYAPPFTVSSDFASATWYYAKLRGSKYVRADETQKDGSGRYLTSTTNERTDEYKWAFVGNPYELSIINKGAGSSKVLYAGSVPVMQAATPASDDKARWVVSSNSNGGFTVRSESGANLYINDAGGGGNLGYWNSASGANDAGSNWIIEEAATSDKNLLYDAIAAAQALVNGAGVPGYINSTAAATLSSAITQAQSVYDDPSGDYASAYNTLATAITTASVPANINYTPRTDVYYTIVNARGAMVYDPSHSSSVDTQNDNAEYIWFSTTPDGTNPNNLWGFIESEGNYYMYNVGKRQFATVGHGSYGNTWIFSNTPAYITLDDGIADEIVPPGVRVRATIATTGNSYTMSVSTNYTGPVITYDAANDGGVPMVFAESSYAVDADVTAVIEALIEDVTPYRNALKDVIDACASIPFGSGLNEYTATSTYTNALAAANTAYNNASATKSDLQTATANLESAMAELIINTPATGKFYRIRGYSNNYITSNTAGNNASMNGTASANNIVYYSAEGNLIFFGSGYGLYNTSYVAPAGSTLNTYSFIQGAQVGKYYVKSNATGMGTLCYDNTSNGTKLDRNTNPVTSGSYQTDWTLEEVTTLPVTISAAKYATLYAPVALTIPTGVTVYTVNDGENAVTMTEINGTVIPANTGVILSAEVGTYNFEITTTTETITTDLTGCFIAATRPEGSYILSGGTYGVGFYKDGPTTVAGFKAYLPASPGGDVKAFYFADDIVTAIEGLNVNGGENGNIYNLAGQRMSKMQRGVNIVNGKKVIVK